MERRFINCLGGASLPRAPVVSDDRISTLPLEVPALWDWRARICEVKRFYVFSSADPCL